MKDKNKAGSLRVLADAGVLLDGLSRLNCCTALLTQCVKCAQFDGTPHASVKIVTAVCELLNNISGDLHNELSACLDEEMAARGLERR